MSAVWKSDSAVAPSPIHADAILVSFLIADAMAQPTAWMYCVARFPEMVKKLYDSGVQLVAGTDQGSGYAFHRELEIYNDAGIPAPEVLRMATLEAAKVLKQDKDFGSIEPGKFADMILVNGDPTKNISDIRHIDAVIEGGNVYKPSELYPAFGIRGE